MSEAVVARAVDENAAVSPELPGGLGDAAAPRACGHAHLQRPAAALPSGGVANVLSIILTAFVTGALARFAVPGPDPMPAWLTVLIGLGGTLIGAGIVVAAVGADPAWFGIAGFLASVTLVVLYRRVIQRRPLWGPDAYRFPERGVGVQEYRDRLQRAGIDPDAIGVPFAGTSPQDGPQPAAGPAGAPGPAHGADPTENPAHYLMLLEELHDADVLDDAEYSAARLRLLERLRR